MLLYFPSFPKRLLPFCLSDSSLYCRENFLQRVFKVFRRFFFGFFRSLFGCRCNMSPLFFSLTCHQSMPGTAFTISPMLFLLLEASPPLFFLTSPANSTTCPLFTRSPLFQSRPASSFEKGVAAPWISGICRETDPLFSLSCCHLRSIISVSSLSPHQVSFVCFFLPTYSNQTRALF